MLKLPAPVLGGSFGPEVLLDDHFKDRKFFRQGRGKPSKAKTCETKSTAGHIPPNVPRRRPPPLAPPPLRKPQKGKHKCKPLFQNSAMVTRSDDKSKVLLTADSRPSDDERGIFASVPIEKSGRFVSQVGDLRYLCTTVRGLSGEVVFCMQHIDSVSNCIGAQMPSLTIKHLCIFTLVPPFYSNSRLAILQMSFCRTRMNFARWLEQRCLCLQAPSPTSRKKHAFKRDGLYLLTHVLWVGLSFMCHFDRSPCASSRALSCRNLPSNIFLKTLAITTPSTSGKCYEEASHLLIVDSYNYIITYNHSNCGCDYYTCDYVIVINQQSTAMTTSQQSVEDVSGMASTTEAADESRATPSNSNITIPPSAPNAQATGLFDLSAELRNQIYEYVLVDSWLHRPMVIASSLSNTFPSRSRRRQIHHEATAMFYGRNAFIVAWQHPCSPFNESTIRHVRILRLLSSTLDFQFSQQRKDSFRKGLAQLASWAGSLKFETLEFEFSDGFDRLLSRHCKYEVVAKEFLGFVSAMMETRGMEAMQAVQKVELIPGHFGKELVETGQEGVDIIDDAVRHNPKLRGRLLELLSKKPDLEEFYRHKTAPPTGRHLRSHFFSRHRLPGLIARHLRPGLLCGRAHLFKKHGYPPKFAFIMTISELFPIAHLGRILPYRKGNGNGILAGLRVHRLTSRRIWTVFFWPKTSTLLYHSFLAFVFLADEQQMAWKDRGEWEGVI
ncbi:uncharacterized protein MYCFIDRAFT_179602 [Pseudocercospora fijiensis CIRAD86]|uniref:Uncharacterized protein n=1 Tax=Pseudocercospora fijiensis (strain CIRAD86) TaxID=383855 RepID=M3A1A5_PSEFD|nr:uncharacterized protein MYCFIDRAFT_179602 [Pseudocercospora fijiensis CIRAD86]EME78166.1 hypothetical protein MYCFIDRAFT_179602 [Pseudocercospora fijiensis CIRAD86]